MKDIPLYTTFAKIEKVDKGMSSDQKFYVETTDQKAFLLRLAGVEAYERKKSEYEIIASMYAAGIPMPSPIDFGICNKGRNVYTLLSWIPGKEVEAVLPKLSDKDQYELGFVSGGILKKIHMLPAPKGTKDWEERYFSVIEERLDVYRKEGIIFEGSDAILSFINQNRQLLKNRPQVYHHGDYHMGNMIQSENKQLSVIDWHTVDFDNYGDPWYEFNRMGIESPFFASGQINGYFDYKIPEEFWNLLALYLSASAITSIVWTKYFAPERTDSILRLNTDILNWYDGMRCTIPTWYLPQI